MVSTNYFRFQILGTFILGTFLLVDCTRAQEPKAAAATNDLAGSLVERVVKPLKNKLIKAGIKKLTKDEKLRYALEAVLTQTSKSAIVLKLVFGLSDPGEDDAAIAEDKAAKLAFCREVLPILTDNYKATYATILATGVALDREQDDLKTKRKEQLVLLAELTEEAKRLEAQNQANIAFEKIVSDELRWLEDEDKLIESERIKLVAEIKSYNDEVTRWNSQVKFYASYFQNFSNQTAIRPYADHFLATGDLIITAPPGVDKRIWEGEAAFHNSINRGVREKRAALESHKASYQMRLAAFEKRFTANTSAVELLLNQRMEFDTKHAQYNTDLTSFSALQTAWIKLSEVHKVSVQEFQNKVDQLALAIDVFNTCFGYLRLYDAGPEADVWYEALMTIHSMQPAASGQSPVAAQDSLVEVPKAAVGIEFGKDDVQTKRYTERLRHIEPFPEAVVRQKTRGITFSSTRSELRNSPLSRLQDLQREGSQTDYFVP